MGLQIWLPLNGDLTNNGLSNATITNSGATVNNNGKIGKCYSFDGSDDYISINTSDLYNTFRGGAQPFTIAFWVYHGDSTRGVVFGDYNLSGTISFNVELTVAHGIRFYWAANPDKVFSTTVANQGWTHITLVYDGTQLFIYKDGELKSDKYTGILAEKNKTSGDFYLGRDSRTGTTALNGRLNDFRIYDEVLSPREIAEIAKGLVLHYPLSGLGNPNLLMAEVSDSRWTSWGSSGWDSSNSRDKVIDENGKTWIHVVQTTSSGYGGYTCGPANNGIVINPNKKYTISALARTNAATTQKMVFWCHWRENNSATNLAQIATQVDVTSTPKRVYATWTPSAGNSDSVVASINLMIGTWNNISNIYFTDVKFEEGEIATNWFPYTIGTQNLFDFESLASKWAAENCTVTDYTDPKYGNVLQMTTTSANQRIYRNVSNVWLYNGNYTVSFLAKSTAPIQCNMSRSIADFSPTFNLTTEWKRYTGVINNTSSNTGGTLSFRLLTAGTVYITGVTLERWNAAISTTYEDNDNIEYDVSGYNNHGSKIGTLSASSDTARYTASTYFNGGDNAITVPFNSVINNDIPFTINLWFKKPDLGTDNYETLFGGPSGFEMDTRSGSATTLSLYMASIRGGNIFSPFNFDEWYMVTMVSDRTNEYYYVNGELKNTIAAKSMPTGDYFIGAWQVYTKQNYKGLISDFRIYATALTADQILALYQTPITLTNSGTLMTQGEFVEVG